MKTDPIEKVYLEIFFSPMNRGHLRENLLGSGLKNYFFPKMCIHEDSPHFNHQNT